MTGNMPPMVEKAIREAYDRLNKETGLGRDVDVAVRSSATAEDLPDASFAGLCCTTIDCTLNKCVLFRQVNKKRF